MTLKRLETAIKVLLLTAAFVPLIVTPFSPFPFVFGKMIFFRSIVQIALILFLIYLGLKKFNLQDLPIQRFKNPLFIAVTLFIVSAAISSAFSVDVFRAFFGDVERGEGLFSILAYFVFMTLSVLFLNLKDWLIFFKLSLGVGIVIFLYAVLQYFGVEKFPFAGMLGQTAQPGSLIGNPAFLATYAIFIICFTAIWFSQSKPQPWVKYVSAALILTSILIIFLVAIRGALIGLAVGMLFLLGFLLVTNKKPVVRKASLLGLLAFILFSLFFVMTRDNPLWRSIPGLDRLSVISVEIPSVKTRLLSIGVSLEAFKERPILGWGLENYSVAYNKYFDPSYSFYAEDWFDRAHNKVLEVLVMQGLLGLLTYLAIFGALFRLLIGRAGRGMPGFEKLIIGACLVIYFVQNLFLFDQINSYIQFFALLGYLVFRTSGENENQVVPSLGAKPRLAAYGLSLIVIATLCYSIYQFGYVLVYQAGVYKSAIATGRGQTILNASPDFLYPYNFMQPTIRSQFVELIYKNNLLNKKDFEPLVDRALESMEEVINQDPHEPRYVVTLVEALNEEGKSEPEIFKKSEGLMRQAIALSPKRQALRYLLAFTLSGEKRFDESIALARETVSLDPDVPQAHYHLAIALALAADDPVKGTLREKYRDEAERELDIARIGAKPNDFYLFNTSDIKNMIILYNSWGNYEKLIEVIEVAQSKSPKNQDYYYDAITVYRALRNAQGIIKNAQKLKNLDPSLGDQMDAIIDLAKNGDWEILNSL